MTFYLEKLMLSSYHKHSVSCEFIYKVNTVSIHNIFVLDRKYIFIYKAPTVDGDHDLYIELSTQYLQV